MDQESKAIIATEGPGSTALALEPELAEALNEVIAAAKSDNTRRAQVAKFEAWCQRRRTNALATTPAVVAIYLTDLAATGADPSRSAKGAKVATVGLALSAISAAHRSAGRALDTKAREIREAMGGRLIPLGWPCPIAAMVGVGRRGALHLPAAWAVNERDQNSCTYLLPCR
jgi:hypothetical protein